MKILTVPEETEILRRKSQPIEKLDGELLAFLKELGETLKGQKDPAGVGLSAIQVGKPLRVFTTFLPQIKNEKLKMKNEKPELIFYVNPEIVGHAEGMTLAPKESYFAPEASGLALAKSDPSGFGRTGGFLHGKNPGPSEENKEEKPFLEGCLSIPSIYGAVLRYPWIKAKATVITENDLSTPSSLFLLPSSFTLEALASRVFQHELDHLNGILFTDHVLAQGNKFYREIGKEMVEMEI